MEGGSGTLPRSTPIPQTTPPTFPYLLLIPIFILLLLPPPIHSLNITTVLSSFPDLSSFTSLLTSTSVLSDLSSRDSITLLAVPNPLLPPSQLSSPSLPDSLRYHVLLRFLTWSDLRQLPPSGTLVPTLFQTTGRAPFNLGSLNLTFNPSTGVISLHPPLPPNPNPNSGPNSSATILSLVKSIPYNLSIFTVSALIAPYTSDIVNSEDRPPSPGVNITKALLDGHNFNVAASMLSASGVVSKFEDDEVGAGITLFIPTDSAFSNLPSTVKLQALPADQKYLVLEFHALHSYYPLGSLESIVNPVQPTLATEDRGAGTYTLNISKVNGSVALNSGLVQAVVTQTVFDQNPVAIFGISNVLLPREIFDGSPSVGSGGDGDVAEPPEVEAAAPEISPGALTPPSHLSSAPGFREEIRSAAGDQPQQGILTLFCTVGLLYEYLIGVFYL